VIQLHGLKLYYDNSIALFMAKNKPIDIKYIAIRKHGHVSTGLMIVDLLTKDISLTNFKDYLVQMESGLILLYIYLFILRNFV